MKGQRSGTALRVIAVLVSAALGLLAAPVAGATPMFVWHGRAPFDWSENANWSGGHAPSPAAGAVDVEFPLSACSQAPRVCPASTDDIDGLTLATLTLDAVTVAFPSLRPHESPPQEPRPAAYDLDGSKPIKLAGGIDADISEEGSGPGVAGASIDIESPLELTGANLWSVGPGRGGALQIGSSLTGRHPLGVELLGQDTLELPPEVETGPITVIGTPGSAGRLSIGSGSEINAADREPLRLQNVTLSGSGIVGPLTLDGATARIGEDSPGGDLEVEGDLTLEGGSTVDLRVPAADQRRPYSAIVHGRAELGDATLALFEGCPAVGTTYTLLAADDGVTGRLSAPDGQVIADGQIIGGETADCGTGASAAPLRLEYEPDAVTVTALAPAPAQPTPSVSTPSGPPAYSAAARALLASDLRWLGAGRRIGSILAGRGEDVAMKAPRPGTFLIQWRVRIGGHSVLIARGRLMLPDGGTGQLRIVLTGAGRAALRHVRHMRVTVLQSFLASGMPSDSSQTILLLRR